MRNWPTPTTLKSLRGFLGLTGYYRRFVKGYGLIAKLLTNLLKKGNFKWNTQAEQSFIELKEAMTKTLVLAMPNFSLPFTLETDASRKPVAYFSKALGHKYLGLSAYEKELLAIVMAVHHWKYYLLGCHFIILTDQQSIKYFADQKLSTLLQQKWSTKLLGFDYSIKYRKGTENGVADALSRMYEKEGELNAITIIKPKWLQEIIGSYDDDANAVKLIAGVQQNLADHPHYIYANGLQRYKIRLYVGSTLRSKILEVVHSSAEGVRHWFPWYISQGKIKLLLARDEQGY